MGWFRKIIDFVRINPTSPKGPAEITLLKFLINDIKRQIKAIENKRNTIVKQEDKLRSKYNDTNEDNNQKLAVFEDDKRNLDECLTIFRKKLDLTENRYNKTISVNADSPEPVVKKNGDLKS